MTPLREPLCPYIVGGPEYHPIILSLYRNKTFRGAFDLLSPGQIWNQAQRLYAEAIDGCQRWLDKRETTNPGDHIAKLPAASAIALLATDAIGELLNAPHNRTELFPLYQEINAFALARSEEYIELLAPGKLDTTPTPEPTPRETTP